MTSSWAPEGVEIYLPEPQDRQFLQQWDIGVRFKQILAAAPMLAYNPDLAEQLAGSNMPIEEVVSNAAGLMAMSNFDGLLQSLQRMSKANQRIAWAGLSEAHKQGLGSLGYTPPDDAEPQKQGGGFFGWTGPLAAVGDVLGTATRVGNTVLTAPPVAWTLDKMAWVGDQPQHLWRQARVLGWDNVAAVAAGATLGAVGALFVPVTGGLSTGVMALGLGMAGGALFGAVEESLTGSFDDWVDAWSDTARGETVFLPEAKVKARRILADSDSLTAYAFDVAWNADMNSLAEAVAGNRDPFSQDVLSHSVRVWVDARMDSTNPRYGEFMSKAQMLANTDDFQAAVRELHNGKISFGRDFARLVGLKEGTGWYNFVSGATDLTSLLVLDPFLAVGSIAKMNRLRRYGVLHDVRDGAATVKRIAEMYDTRKPFAYVVDTFADAVRTGDVQKLRRVAPTMLGQLDAARAWDNVRLLDDPTLDAFSKKEFFQFLSEGDSLTRLFAGHGTRPGLSKLVMPTRGIQVFGMHAFKGGVIRNSLADLVWYVDDLAMDADIARRIRRADADSYASGRVGLATGKTGNTEAFRGATSVEQTIARIPGLEDVDVLRFGSNETRSLFGMRPRTAPEGMLQNLAFLVDHMPVANKAMRLVGTMAAGMGTMLPDKSAIMLEGPKAAEQITRLTNMARAAGMGSVERRAWRDSILGAAPGHRPLMVTAFLDSLLSHAGLRQTDEMSEMVDRFISRYRHVHFVDPDLAKRAPLMAGDETSSVFASDMAVMMPMPNFVELSRQARKGLLLPYINGGIHRAHIDTFMSKVWKPSVLLRLSFIPRAAGEEMLSFIMREGMGAYIKQFGERSIAEGELYDELLESAVLKNLNVAPQDLERVTRALARFQYAGHVRWLERLFSHTRWSSPVSHTLAGYTRWVRGQMKDGLLPQRLGAWLSDESNTLHKLLYRENNPNTWRRHLLTGYSDTDLEAAKLFYAGSGRAVIDEMTSQNASMFALEGANREKKIVIKDRDGNLVEAPLLVAYSDMALGFSGADDYARKMRWLAAHTLEDAAWQQPLTEYFLSLVPRSMLERAWWKPGGMQASLDELALRYAQMSGSQQYLVAELFAPDSAAWDPMLRRLRNVEDVDYGRLADALADDFPTTPTREMFIEAMSTGRYTDDGVTHILSEDNMRIYREHRLTPKQQLSDPDDWFENVQLFDEAFADLLPYERDWVIGRIQYETHMDNRPLRLFLPGNEAAAEAWLRTAALDRMRLPEVREMFKNNPRLTRVRGVPVADPNLRDATRVHVATVTPQSAEEFVTYARALVGGMVPADQVGWHMLNDFRSFVDRDEFLRSLTADEQRMLREVFVDSAPDGTAIPTWDPVRGAFPVDPRKGYRGGTDLTDAERALIGFFGGAVSARIEVLDDAAAELADAWRRTIMGEAMPPGDAWVDALPSMAAADSLGVLPIDTIAFTSPEQALFLSKLVDRYAESLKLMRTAPPVPGVRRHAGRTWTRGTTADPMPGGIGNLYGDRAMQNRVYQQGDRFTAPGPVTESGHYTWRVKNDGVARANVQSVPNEHLIRDEASGQLRIGYTYEEAEEILVDDMIREVNSRLRSSRVAVRANEGKLYFDHMQRQPVPAGHKLTQRDVVFDDVGNQIQWTNKNELAPKRKLATEFERDRVSYQLLDKGDWAWEGLGGHLRDQVDDLTRRKIFYGDSVRHPGLPDYLQESQYRHTGTYRASRASEQTWAEAVEKPGVAYGPRLAFEEKLNLPERIVRYGFDRVIAPGIDAAIRRPMAFHYFREAYNENRRMMNALKNKRLFAQEIPEQFDVLLVQADQAMLISEADAAKQARVVLAHIDPAMRTMVGKLTDREALEALYRRYSAGYTTFSDSLATMAADADPLIAQAGDFFRADALGNAMFPVWSIKLRYADDPGEAVLKLYEDQIGASNISDITRRTKAAVPIARRQLAVDADVSRMDAKLADLANRDKIAKTVLDDTERELTQATATGPTLPKPGTVGSPPEVRAAHRQVLNQRKIIRDLEAEVTAEGTLPASRIAGGYRYDDPDFSHIPTLADEVVDPIGPLLREAADSTARAQADAAEALRSFDELIEDGIHPAAPWDKMTHQSRAEYAAELQARVDAETAFRKAARADLDAIMGYPMPYPPNQVEDVLAAIRTEMRTATPEQVTALADLEGRITVELMRRGERTREMIARSGRSPRALRREDIQHWFTRARARHEGTIKQLLTGKKIKLKKGEAVSSERDFPALLNRGAAHFDDEARKLQAELDELNKYLDPLANDYYKTLPEGDPGRKRPQDRFGDARPDATDEEWLTFRSLLREQQQHAGALQEQIAQHRAQAAAMRNEADQISGLAMELETQLKLLDDTSPIAVATFQEARARVQANWAQFDRVMAQYGLDPHTVADVAAVQGELRRIRAKRKDLLDAAKFPQGHPVTMGPAVDRWAEENAELWERMRELNPDLHLPEDPFDLLKIMKDDDEVIRSAGMVMEAAGPGAMWRGKKVQAGTAEFYEFQSYQRLQAMSDELAAAEREVERLRWHDREGIREGGGKDASEVPFSEKELAQRKQRMDEALAARDEAQYRFDVARQEWTTYRPFEERADFELYTDTDRRNWTAQRRAQLEADAQVAQAQAAAAQRALFDGASIDPQAWRQSEQTVRDRIDMLEPRIAQAEARLAEWRAAKEAEAAALPKTGLTMGHTYRKVDGKKKIAMTRAEARQEAEEAVLRWTAERNHAAQQVARAKTRKARGSEGAERTRQRWQARLNRANQNLKAYTDDLAVLRVAPGEEQVMWQATLDAWKAEVDELNALLPMMDPGVNERARQAAVRKHRLAKRQQTTKAHIDSQKSMLAYYEETERRVTADWHSALSKQHDQHVAKLEERKNAVLAHRDALDADMDAYQRQRQDRLGSRPERKYEMFEDVDPVLLAQLQLGNAGQVLARAQKNLRYIEETAASTAQERAIQSGMQFIDSHEIRSQYGEAVKNFAPFWYAEENFLKRWARSTVVNPNVIRKMQLMYAGMKSGGVIYTDPNGEDYFIVPMSGVILDELEDVAHLPVFSMLMPAVPGPQGLTFAMQTNSILPGADFSRTGIPQVSPVAGLSMKFVAQKWPELDPIERALAGEGATSRAWYKSILPSTLSRFFEAITGNPENSARYASAVLTMAQAKYAMGQAPGEGASAAEVQEWEDELKNATEGLLLAQTVFGFVLPGSPTALWDGGENTTITKITGVGYDNAIAELRAEYLELIDALGVEEGTLLWIALHSDEPFGGIVNPSALAVSKTTTSGGAPIPATDEAHQFYLQNEAFFHAYPDAAPWLLPGNPDDHESFDFERYNEQIRLKLRDRRTPEEFIRMMYFKQGSFEYFKEKKEVDRLRAEYAAAGNQEAVRSLNAMWDNFAVAYKTQRPIFAEELSEGNGLRRRRQVQAQLQQLILDPITPLTPQTEAVARLVRSFRTYTNNVAILGQSRSEENLQRLELEKIGFSQWLAEFLARHPDLEPLWHSVYQPDAALSVG